MNDLCARDAKKLYYSIELRFIPCGSATPVMTHLTCHDLTAAAGRRAGSLKNKIRKKGTHFSPSPLPLR
jgi:hypothetical protein